ncbi:glutaredoxin family protein [Halorubrum sp. DTA98]|uniref:glutaredoxin family protein n=1 Tax=Halorubrum sp. DTA98 TaxID=3402163 RepID=UPI003AAB5DA0
MTDTASDSEPPVRADTADAASGDGDDSATDGVSVTIYTREGCSLCVTARETVERVADDVGVAVDIAMIDVDEDPELAAEYGERVPYVLVDGHPSFKYEIDERELRLKLLASS